jgi:peptide-methionine (S)-S-oxide reductase
MEGGMATKEPNEMEIRLTDTLINALKGLSAVCPSFSGSGNNPGARLPEPVLDATCLEGSGTDSIVIAGGCFWGVQAVFQHVKGVVSAVSGYAGGARPNPTYEQVCTGVSGHAEAVQITFLPNVVSLGRLLQVFFSVAHDPTQLNRQGPDRGTQYRSALFVKNTEQAEIANAYMIQLDQAGCFASPIVTQIATLDVFYPAETYHQDYATLNPDNPYIATHDLPKVVQLNTLYPDLYCEAPRLVGDHTKG